MTPTYYVQHPDGSYSVADPQPQQDAQAVPQEYSGVRCMCVLTGCRAGSGCPRYNSHCRAHINHVNAAPTPPAQRVMLTDEEIAALPVWTHFVGLMTDSKSDIARAVIEAYEIKNGLKP